MDFNCIGIARDTFSGLVQVVRGRFQSMRRVMVVTSILILSLVIPSVNATESRETDCISGSPLWSLEDQECAVYALGSIVPGEVHSIQFQTDNEVDVLIFSQAGLSVYSNDQWSIFCYWQYHNRSSIDSFLDSS